jgi:hypothetical protein
VQRGNQTCPLNSTYADCSQATLTILILLSIRDVCIISQFATNFDGALSVASLQGEGQCMQLKLEKPCFPSRSCS